MVTPKHFSKESLRQHFLAVGLDVEDPRPVKEYSGGMKRRVALLRAVLFPAEMVIMDEPFKGLDEALKGEVITYLKETLTGRTVLIITHEKDDVALLSADLLSWRPEE